MDTFNPPIPPQEGAQGTTRFNVTEIVFGDGYVSSFGNGLHNKFQVWPMTWKGTVAEITPIRDFFDAHAGYKKFLWTPPLGVQGYYVVKEYSPLVEAAGNAQITATFEQRFAP